MRLPRLESLVYCHSARRAYDNGPVIYRWARRTGLDTEQMVTRIRMNMRAMGPDVPGHRDEAAILNTEDLE
ncbi:MAG: hypothetical protein ABIH23_24260 [bacterium]